MNARSLASPIALTFIVTFAIALIFAATTNHVWEDYYITFRSSKNLAEGHGLVFNQGDRLHTFTSPLGVLLPALAYKLTGDRSDSGAIWIFRFFTSGAFAASAALMVVLLSKLKYRWPIGLGAAVALATDAKSLDFAINGMETPFVLLFVAYTFWAHLHAGPRRWMHLGIAWGGLQWTRPDGFIYGMLLAAGFFLFNDRAVTGSTRRELLRSFAFAAALGALIYLPWLVWASAYYGTPIPHTITAKGSLGRPHTVLGLLLIAVKLPYLAWTDFATLEHTFLPSYYFLGGWPQPLIVASRALATVCMLLWLVPRLNLATRVASFAFFGGHVYLTYFPYFPFPWYIPTTTLLAIIALAGAFGQWVERPSQNRLIIGVLAGVLLASGIWETWQVRRQVATQQRMIENETREKIGVWLKEQSKPGDAVFVEPLGYIGYFSNLKTYDYPGMSSREMVRARKTFGEEWGRLLFELRPRWLVLRPFEADRIAQVSTQILGTHYQIVKEFDHLAEVKRLDVFGRPYLEHDARFTVFELKQPFSDSVEPLEVSVPFPTSKQMIEGISMTLFHAPSRMVVRVPPRSKRVLGHYCISPAAIEADPKTDGARFTIRLHSGSQDVVLLDRTLDPANRPEDRPLLSFDFNLPRDRSLDATLIFEISPGATNTKDWTFWQMPIFQ